MPGICLIFHQKSGSVWLENLCL